MQVTKGVENVGRSNWLFSGPTRGHSGFGNSLVVFFQFMNEGLP